MVFLFLLTTHSKLEIGKFVCDAVYLNCISLGGDLGRRDFSLIAGD